MCLIRFPGLDKDCTHVRGLDRSSLNTLSTLYKNDSKTIVRPTAHGEAKILTQ